MKNTIIAFTLFFSLISNVNSQNFSFQNGDIKLYKLNDLSKINLSIIDKKRDSILEGYIYENFNKKYLFLFYQADTTYFVDDAKELQAGGPLSIYFAIVDKLNSSIILNKKLDANFFNGISLVEYYDQNNKINKYIFLLNIFANYGGSGIFGQVLPIDPNNFTVDSTSILSWGDKMQKHGCCDSAELYVFEAIWEDSDMSYISHKAKIVRHSFVNKPTRVEMSTTLKKYDFQSTILYDEIKKQEPNLILF